MISFSPRRCGKLFLFFLKTKAKTILLWCIGLFGIMFLYMILFPSMKEMAQMKFDGMPKELMQFMGMESMQDMGNYMHYFGMIFQIWLIVISFFAASFSGGLIVQEEKRKTIEYLYAMPISRFDIYFAKVATAFLAVLAVVACTGISAMICGAAVGGETYQASELMLIVKLSGFIPFFFLAAAFLLCGLSASFGASAANGCVLVLYLLGYLGAILEKDGEWLTYFSPFECFSPQKILSENWSVPAFSAYLALFFVLIAAGAFFYHRRDFR